MTLYLDTSSLVKLYVPEDGSETVRALVSGATVVATSALAYPETRAALARRRREGTLGARTFAAAKKAFDEEWPRFLAIDVSSGVCREAGAFAERYRLGACDSVHLAAFAVVARAGGVGETRFSSFDAALNRAATSLKRNLASAGRRRT